MSFENPTALRVGMTGTLVGKRYRIAGRIVMGMEDGGETYYWNEFNLLGDAGESATLVCEETERGGEWRIFTFFEPQFPMTATEAASRRVGETINLEGQSIPITLVDESRVYHIEGQAPEGVEVGDVAQYFNAGADNRMTVVSWTGNEIEFYHGLNLPRDAVASAFGIQRDALSTGFVPPGSARFPSGNRIVSIVVVFLGIVSLFATLSSCRSARHRTTVVKTTVPAPTLSLESVGVLDGKTYRIRMHTLVEIGKVGQIFERHEYHLADEAGNNALLIYGSKPGAKDWLFCTPIEPPVSLTPQQAAAKRVGETITLDGTFVTVTEFFQSTIRQTEGGETPGGENGRVFYGFGGKSQDALFFARWNTKGMTFYKGKAVKEPLAAFSQKSAN